MQLRFAHAAALVAAVSFSLASVDAEGANACVQANDEAQSLRQAGKLREARAQLLVCAQKNCNSVIRNDCEKWLKEVDEATPTIVVRLVDSRGQDVLGARVTIDEARIELDGKPVQVDPGQRTVKARAKSGDVAETKVLTAQSEKARVIEVKFTTELNPDGTRVGVTGPAPPSGEDKVTPPAPAGEPFPVLPLVFAVVGGVALGAFTFFEITGQSAYGDLENTCAKTKSCTDADIDPVQSKFVAAGVSLGISVIALGAAVVLYVTRPKGQTTAFDFSPVVHF